MSLGDIIGNLDLALFPQIALILFLAIFVFVCVRALRKPRSEVDAMASIPLDDSKTPVTPRHRKRGD